jgi:V8-like Glu-specific endopeptidase
MRAEAELIQTGRTRPARPSRARPFDPAARLLDAWHASYSGALTVSQLLKQPRSSESAAAEDILATGDDRQPVNNTLSLPWRWICSLFITAIDGSQWLGTGWLAGPRLVITAGHCVFIHGRGGWAQEILVFPARNGTSIPFQFSCTEFRSVQGWVQGQNSQTDYGAILLPEPTDQLGWFGYEVLSNDDLADLLVNVFGYPADKAQGTLWGNDRTLAQIMPRTLVYDISTYGGQSGGPVFIKAGGKRYVVGIHNYGDLSGNSATRITGQVFDNIEAWRSESEGSDG